MNRTELEKKTHAAFHEQLHKCGYVSVVNVLLTMGKLSQQDYEAWRSRRVPYLERVIRLNLSQLSAVLRQVEPLAREGGLKPSLTVYTSHGKGRRVKLQFSRYGHPALERRYATHHVSHQ